MSDEAYVFPATMLHTAEVADLRPDVLDETGRLTVKPAHYYAATTARERAVLGHRTGSYVLPTVELIDRLREIIAGRTAIEIGAGNGVVAEALDIPATDNFQQQMPKYKAIYEQAGQPLVPYGPNVVDMHASRAVRHYKPDVVIGCWVTHKYDPDQHEAGGNEIGVDMRDVLMNCKELVLVGNQHTQGQNPMWNRKHQIELPPYVYSRATNGAPEFIARWKGSKR